jgi:hypothetical protein
MPSTHISLHYHIVFCTKGATGDQARFFRLDSWQEGYGGFSNTLRTK